MREGQKIVLLLLQYALNLVRLDGDGGRFEDQPIR